MTPDNRPNILLMGLPGTGKTHSAQTLLSCGIQIFSIFHEPRWQPLNHLSCEDGFHLHYLPPTTGDWQSLIRRADNLRNLPWDAATKVQDIHKAQYDGYARTLQLLARYSCQRCGEIFTDVNNLPPDSCLWYDGLSGLNTMALQGVVGMPTVRSLPQWGAAMESEMSLLHALCYSTQCWFVLVAHVERAINEDTGALTTMVNALGRKNAPIIPKDFDDVILAERQGDKFTWSNARAMTDTKPGYLPISNSLPQDFAPIVRTWDERKSGPKAPVQPR